MSERHDPAKRPGDSVSLLQARRRWVRPHDVAWLISTVWLFAVVVFGIVEHVIDDQTFPQRVVGDVVGTRDRDHRRVRDVVP